MAELRSVAKTAEAHSGNTKTRSFQSNSLTAQSSWLGENCCRASVGPMWVPAPGPKRWRMKPRFTCRSAAQAMLVSIGRFMIMRMR